MCVCVGGGGGGGGGGLGPLPIIVEGAEPTYPISPPPAVLCEAIKSTPTPATFLCEAIRNRSQMSKMKGQMRIYLLFNSPRSKGHSELLPY